jgi:DNA (cytosine-5)-methyltransferase 1
MTKPKDPIGGFDATVCSVAEPLSFGSLFAGIGGFDLGFERAGMVCKWQVEIDDYANRVLAKHWPNVHRERDIRETGPHNLERVNVICGGFPCQDISYAGLGAGLDGARSGLFFEAIRLVRELRPQFVVLENVAALLDRGLDRVLGTLAEIGFDAEWHCIPASAVGSPQQRERAFVVAYDCGVGVSRVCAEQVPRFDAFSWVEDVRRFEDLPERCDLYTSRLCGSRDGVPSLVDRLRGLGNAVVPQVAEYIGRCIVASVSRAK